MTTSGQSVALPEHIGLCPSEIAEFYVALRGISQGPPDFKPHRCPNCGQQLIVYSRGQR